MYLQNNNGDNNIIIVIPNIPGNLLCIVSYSSFAYSLMYWYAPGIVEIKKTKTTNDIFTSILKSSAKINNSTEIKLATIKINNIINSLFFI